MPLFGPPNISALQSRKDIPGLIRALGYRSDQGEVRTAAVRALGIIGEPALPHLVQALRSSESSIRYGAAEALGLTNLEQAVQPLAKGLSDLNASVRRAAALSLGSMSCASALQALSDAANASDLLPQAAAIDALSRIVNERTLPILVNLLGAPTYQQRMAAAEALQAVGQAAVPGVIHAMQHGDENMRRAAAEVLGGIRSEQAIPALIEALGDPSEYVILAATDALKACREMAVLPMMRVYFNGDTNLRPVLGKALLKMEEVARPALLTALKQGTPAAREQIVHLISQAGEAWTIAPLAALLDEPNVSLRYLAVQGLSRTGLVEVIPHLLHAAADENEYVQREALKALEHIRHDVKDPTILRQIDQSIRKR